MATSVYVPLTVAEPLHISADIVQDVVYAVVNTTSWTQYEIDHDDFDRDVNFPIVRSPPHGQGEQVDRNGVSVLCKPSGFPWIELSECEIRVHEVSQLNENDGWRVFGTALNEVVKKHAGLLSWPDSPPGS
jgi:hypothetical protein